MPRTARRPADETDKSANVSIMSHRHSWRSRVGVGVREGRVFDRGEFSLVILALVGEKPRYGYEIIKKLGERVGGDYSPSPGIVYPTLIAMEGLGYASVTQDPSVTQDQARRKLYTVTPE